MFHVKHYTQNIVCDNVKHFCNKIQNFEKKVYQHYPHNPHIQYFVD